MSEMSRQADPDGEKGHLERERIRHMIDDRFTAIYGPKRKFTGGHRPTPEPVEVTKTTPRTTMASHCGYYKVGCQPANCKNCRRAKAARSMS